jgi:hypothetical protein
MAPLTSFELRDCDMATFMIFFLEKSWYEKFLRDKLEDKEVQVGDWDATQGSAILTRKIRSFHPSKVSFPGLPSHAESLKTQSLTIRRKSGDDDEQLSTSVHISEVNSFRDIPYADYFNVHLDWHITCSFDDTNDDEEDSENHRDESKSFLLSDEEKGNSSNRSYKCQVDVSLDFKFFQSTWLQSTIEGNTKSELLGVYDIWYKYAKENLNWARNYNEDLFYTRNYEKISFSIFDRDCSTSGSGQDIIEEIEGAVTPRSTIGGDMRKPGNNTNSFTLNSQKQSHNNLNNIEEFSFGGSNDYDDYDDDDDIINSSSNGQKYDDDDDGEDLFYDAMDMHEFHKKREIDAQYHRHTPPSRNEFTSTRDLAISMVEVMFVLGAALWWKINNFYSNTIDLLVVDPIEVLGKIQETYILSRNYELILKRPDLWGPLVAVIALPESLLLSLEVTKHGCNQSSMLGSGVIVSFSIWIGLSFFL